jgi:imidazole glycerol-phosphate synthase subunit HisH
VSVPVTVVDYGIGNLYSVARALEVCGASVHVTTSHEGIEQAERVVLPGVGAFEDGMKGLAQRGQIEPLMRFMASGRPFLGICVGMQLLFEVGEEFGLHRGLGALRGRVQPVPATGSTGAAHRIPHIGWNVLLAPSGCNWDGTLLRQLPAEPSVYFVHSFAPVPARESDRLADCLYDGRQVCAVVQAGNVAGCQFHPEKSGPNGLHILRNFLSG